MGLPADTFTWATDTNFASGADTGQPTKVDPGAGNKAQGLIPGNLFLGAWFNWLLNVIGQHLTYLRTLHSDVYFLGRNYVWTATHSFTAALTTVVGLVATSFVHVVGGLQLRGASEVTYNDAAGAAAPKSRTMLVKIQRYARAIATAGSDSYGRYGSVGLITQVNSDIIDFELDLPSNAVLKAVRVGWYNSGTGGTATIEVIRCTPNKVTPGSASETTIAPSPVGITATGVYQPTSGTLSAGVTIDNATQFIYVRVTSSASASSGNEGPMWIEYTFDDYGPRNG